MTNGESNTLTLSTEDVLQSDSDELKILGDVGDTVILGGEWFATEGMETTSEGTFFENATEGGLTLWIDQDVAVVPPIAIEIL